MITSTAPAKPPPFFMEKSSSASGGVRVRSDMPPVSRLGMWGVVRASFFARRAKASGTTSSESEGAATMPIATADWPLSRPTATSTANEVRKTDSERISAVKGPKRRWPARKPRAK